MNENTNGLLREYYPKCCELRKVSEEDLKEVVKEINKSPRKELGYRILSEIWLSKRST